MCGIIRSLVLFKYFFYTLLTFVFTFVSFFPTITSAAQVTLVWNENSEDDLAGYRIFCREDGQDYDYSTPAWEGTETTCTIFDLNNDTNYSFVARAYNIDGNESGNSNEVRYETNSNDQPLLDDQYETNSNDQPLLDDQIVFSPDTMVFTVGEGGGDSSQTTLDTSDGISTSYTVDDDATWLTVTPASGSTPATLGVSIDSTGLSPGVYTATVTVIAMGYIEDTLGVTLMVTSTGSLYDLLLSLSPDRSNPVPLDGEAVAGDIYVFTSPDDGVSQVQFFLDDPEMIGEPIQIENLAPYDFAASTSGQVYGYPYDTTQLPDGTHEITALIKLDGGGNEIVSSTFTVANNEQELLFTDITNANIQGVEQGGHGAAWSDIDQDLKRLEAT